MMRRVLILDGDISFIVRLRKALETQAFEVKTARRLAAATEEIEAHHFDIAVVDLSFDDFETVLQHLRDSHPTLPIILSGRNEEDAAQVNRIKAQAYINKPYVARDLITIIEWTLAKAATIDESPSALFDNDAWLDEPPIDDSATIGDMMTAWLSTGDGDTLSGELPPDSLPESTAAFERKLLAEEPPITPEDSVASRVLRLSHDDARMDNLLNPSMVVVTIQPLPSWYTAPSLDDQAKIAALLGEIPQIILPPAANALAAPTQPLALPEIDLIPEDPTPMPDRLQRSDRLNVDLLEALAEAEHAEDTRLQAALRDMSNMPPETPSELDMAHQQLVATSVQEITQSMGIVLDDEEVIDIEPIVSEEEAEATLVAQAALQLTQLSLESAAIGTMLTYEGRVIANIGDLTKAVWGDVAAQIAAAWEQSDGNNTRLVYRMLERHGQVLMFSMRTADDLILTLVFSASTPLKVIRRQAKRIGEALANVEPTALSEELGASHPTKDDEPPAAVTVHSRPTDLKPPPDLRRATDVAEAVAKPQREEGSYASYALVWLVQNQDVVVDDQFKTAIDIWLHRIAEEELWEIMGLDVQEGWINLYIEAPAKVVPSVIATTLMQQSQQAIYDAYATLRDTATPIWSDSYSILTPGRLMTEREIERFVRYHTLADS